MQNRKYLFVFSMIVIVGIGVYSYRHASKAKTSKVAFAKEAVEKMAYELAQPFDKTNQGIEANRYLKKLLLTQQESKFLYLATRSILLDVRGGAEASRYVALLPTMFSSPQAQYILRHDNLILNQNAKQILASLEKNRSVIFADPTLHQALLNLVNHLEIPVSYKMSMYVSSLFRPLEIEKNGSLSSRSQSFEISLLFMKNAGVSGAYLSEAMEKLNSEIKDKDKRLIVREKVASFYPEFQNLFL